MDVKAVFSIHQSALYTLCNHPHKNFFETFQPHFNVISFVKFYILFDRKECSTIIMLTFSFKNGGRGTKPTYIFLVIIPLLVIELKATPNGNPSDANGKPSDPSDTEFIFCLQ